MGRGLAPAPQDSGCDCADAVPEARVRHVYARPAASPCAPAKVQVLPLHEEGRIEAAELEQLRPPDEHGRAVCADRRNRLAGGDIVLEMEPGDVLVEHA